jgi:hypothetical protein
LADAILTLAKHRELQGTFRDGPDSDFSVEDDLSLKVSEA